MRHVKNLLGTFLPGAGIAYDIHKARSKKVTHQALVEAHIAKKRLRYQVALAVVAVAGVVTTAILTGGLSIPMILGTYGGYCLLRAGVRAAATYRAVNYVSQSREVIKAQGPTENKKPQQEPQKRFPVKKALLTGFQYSPAPLERPKILESLRGVSILSRRPSLDGVMKPPPGFLELKTSNRLPEQPTGPRSQF
jgi:hypothetical protein